MATKVSAAKSAGNGSVYLEWDILFKSVKGTAKIDQVIKDLMTYIKGEIKPPATPVPLSYELFKSESNTLLYIFRVYKKTANIAKTKAAARSSVIISPLAAVEGGPSHPPGPPSTPPDSLFSITPVDIPIP
jgi:hypothetical protein